MDNLPSISTLVIVATILVIGYCLRQSMVQQPISGIPHNRSSAHTILGDALGMLGHFKKQKTVWDWTSIQAANLNSPVIQLFIRPFGNPIVFLFDIREGQDIQTRRTHEFDRSKFFGDLFAGTIPNHSIRMPTNEKFKKQRRLLMDTMSNRFLTEVAGPHVVKASQDLVELWTEKARLTDGHAFAANEDIAHFAMEGIWAITFGSEIGALKTHSSLLKGLYNIELPVNHDSPAIIPAPAVPADYEALITITKSLQPAAVTPFPLLAHWWERQSPKYRKAVAHKNRLVQERIRDAKVRMLQSTATEAGINSAVDNLVYREKQAADREGREPEYDSPNAKDELTGFIIAGNDTSAATFSWIVKFLADAPQYQNKLRDAIYEYFVGDLVEDGQPTTQALIKAQIPYLDAAVEESLRLAHTTPGTLRKALVDTQVLGYHIPAGTDVFCMSNSFGVDVVSRWAPPEESKRSKTSRETKNRTGTWDSNGIMDWIPDRWLKTDEKGQTVFDFHAGPSTPFGLGPRGCFGEF